MEENVTDALKIAGSVLLFVIGLSIAFFYFSQARQSIDTVLYYSDRESMVIENDERFYYIYDDSDENKNKTSRFVGKETIIPSLYRAYKENFKIVFKLGDYWLLKKDGEEIKTLDLEKQSIASDAASRWFLNGIVYGKFDNDDTVEIESKSDFEKYFKILANDESLFQYLSGIETSNIKEELGTYFIEDVGETKESVEDINKTEKRVITYSLN